MDRRTSRWLGSWRRWQLDLLARAGVGRLWLTGPLAVASLALGFSLQGLASRTAPAPSSRVLDALLATPATPPAQAASGQGPGQADRSLEGLQARRAVSSTRQGVDLVEPEPGAPIDLEIRVALQSRNVAGGLGATGTWRLHDGRGHLLQSGSPGEPLSGRWLQGGGPAELWLETTPGDSLLLDGRRYPGRLRLIQQGNGWLAINHLGLEQYIASVVGSEMPASWEHEALRSQAVAARSYALAHMARPANAHWHLGDTTRWQAYRGQETIGRRTRAAAASTAGLILSYQGAIVESLYAANRSISLEAHGHLGASMSQHGAQELARRGRRYTQILASYYPGASLARLRRGEG